MSSTPTLREFARSTSHTHDYEDGVCRFCSYHKLETKFIQKTCSHRKTKRVSTRCGPEIVCQDCGHKEFPK